MKLKFYRFMESIFFDASMWLQNISGWFGDKAMYADTELQKRVWKKYNKLVEEGKINGRSCSSKKLSGTHEGQDKRINRGVND